VFFAHKKYSCRLVEPSHLDYFNSVFTNFSWPANFNSLAAYGGVRQLSDFIKNILSEKLSTILDFYHQLQVQPVLHKSSLPFLLPIVW